MKHLLILLTGLFITTCLFSQDKIYKKGGEIIKAKIIEIGTDEIKYKLFDKPDGPIYSIEKDRIIQIVYEDGHTEIYRSNFKDPELYKEQLKNALKINFLSPLWGYLEFSFEHSVKPGKSFEVNASFIGLGKNSTINYTDPNSFQLVKRDARGFVLGAGYKFSRLPDFLNKGMKYSHVLQGAYVKPTLYFGAYSENAVSDKSGQSTLVKNNIVFGSMMLELGKQWIFGESVSLDVYFGLGYVVDNDNNDNSSINSAYHFTVARLGTSPGFGLNGGIKLGILLK